jgi:hypothetical protein
VLAYGLVSNHFDPPYRQPMSLDTEAPLASVSAAHLYTTPDTGSVHTALDLDEALDYLRGSRNLGTLRQNQRCTRILCGGFVPTAVDEGIEADVPFIPLASAPASQGLDRPRTRHYGHRAGMGGGSKAVYSRLSLRYCTRWTKHVGVSQRVQARVQTIYSASGPERRSGQDHGVGSAGV